MVKILIVDDDPTIVDFLKLLLESEGYEAYEAVDGTMALAELERINPEVVLLDYMMPNVDGLHVLHTVSKKFLSSFVVMLTGKGTERIAVECMKAGAADYVVKPFDNEHLLGVIRNVLRLREAEMQKRSLSAEVGALTSRVVALLEKAKPTNGGSEYAEALSLLDQIRRKLGS